MAEQCEPRRTTVLTVRAILGCQHAADHVLVQLDSEALGQLLGNLGTAQMRVAAFEINDGLDQVLARSLGTGFTFPTGGVEPLEFEFGKRRWQRKSVEGLIRMAVCTSRRGLRNLAVRSFFIQMAFQPASTPLRRPAWDSQSAMQSRQQARALQRLAG